MEPNKYEMGVIVRADLEEEVFRAEMERVKGFIERFGGTIEKMDDWGRRKLAYPIMKLTEGMYTFITYTAKGGNTPKEVEARLRLQENVLRFLTIRLGDDVNISQPPVKVVEAAPVAQEAPVAEEAPAPAAEEPVAEVAAE